MIKKNNKNKVFYRLSWIILGIPYLFYAIIFSFLPSKIPAHTNANGIVDRWIEKTNLEIVIVCSMALILALIVNTITKAIIDHGVNESLKETTTGKILFVMSSLFVIINISLMIYMYLYLPTIYK